MRNFESICQTASSLRILPGRTDALYVGEPAAAIPVRKNTPWGVKGNTMVEYLFVGVLVLGVLGGALTMLGNSLNHVSKNLSNEFDERAARATAQELHDSHQASSSGQADVALMLQQPFAIIAVDSFGQVIASPARPFASGANGGTIFLGFFMTPPMIRPVPSTETTSQDEFMLQTLANTSHEAGNLEGHLETIYNYSSGDLSRFKATQVMVNGQLLNASQLADRLHETADQVNQQTDQVLQHSTLDDQTRTDVASHASDVAHHADHVSSTTRDVLNTNGNLNQVSEVIDPDSTHDDASAICRDGRRTDNGRRCGELDDNTPRSRNRN